MHTKTLTAAAVTTAFVLTLSFANTVMADTVFAEQNFAPSDWTAETPFWLFQPNNGETFTATSSRFMTGNPTNSFMVTQFMIDIPNFTVNFAMAPILMNDWTYDPGAEGPIDSISAGVVTLPVAPEVIGNFGTIRLYVVQSGHIYASEDMGSMQGHALHDPAQWRTFDNATAEDFFEIIPNNDSDFNSHPDFAGDEMQFGFGYQLHSTFLSGKGQVARVAGFDDAQVWIHSIPEPGSLVLMGLGGLALSLRRMMR